MEKKIIKNKLLIRKKHITNNIYETKKYKNLLYN